MIDTMDENKYPLYYGIGADNSEFLKAFEEMHRIMETTANLTDTKAKQMAKALMEVEKKTDAAKEAFAKLSSSGEADSAKYAKAVNLISQAEEALASKQERMRITYEKQLLLLQSLEDSYANMQKQLEGMTGSDPEQHNLALEKLANLKAEIETTKASVAAAGKGYDVFAQQATEAIEQARQAQEQYKLTVADAADQEKTLLDQKKDSMTDIVVEYNNIESAGVKSFDENIQYTEEQIAAHEREREEMERLRAEYEEQRKAQEALSNTAEQRVESESALARIQKLSSKELVSTYVGQVAAVRALEQAVRDGDTARTDELNDEKALLQTLKETMVQKVKGITLMRELTNLLYQENSATKENTAYKQALKDTINALGNEYEEANAQKKQLLKEGAGLSAVMSGIQGMMGVFTAAQGVMGLFAKSEEDLAKTQTTLQSVMAVTIGLQQVYNLVNKESEFRITVVSAATKLWTKAQQGLAVAFNMSATAAKALTATLTLGLSVIIPIIITQISKFISKQKEARQAMDEFNKSVAELASKNIVSLEDLSRQWTKLGGNIDAQKKFIKDHQEEFEALGVSVTSVADAENLLVTNKESFVKSLMAKAKAMATAEVLAEKYKELLRKILELEATPEKKNTPSFSYGYGGQTRAKTTKEVSNPRHQELETELKEMQAGISAFYDTVEKYILEEEDALADAHIQQFNKNAKKEAEERAKAAKKAFEEYKKSMQDEVKKMSSVLSGRDQDELQQYLSETDLFFEQYFKKQDAAISKEISIYGKKRTLEDGFREWKLKSMAEGVGKEMAILESQQLQEQGVWASWKQQYLMATGLSELPADIKAMYDKILENIDQFYAQQKKKTEENFKGKDYSGIFGDLSTLSSNTLKQLREAAQKELETNTNLTIEEQNRLAKAIANVTKQLRKANPYSELLKAYKEWKEKGGDDPDALKNLQTAAGFVQNDLNAIWDIASQIGDIVGEEWKEAFSKAQSIANGLMQSLTGESSVQKITGLISAIVVAAQTLADIVNSKLRKNIQSANAETELLAGKIDEIASKKGLGDSLFTTDSFNKIKQLSSAMQTALNEVSVAGSVLYRKFADQANKLSSVIFKILDPTDLVNKMLNTSQKKFIEQNQAAINYFDNLKLKNLETVEDLESALTELEAASAKTSGELGQAYLTQARTALEKALEAKEQLQEALSSMVGDIGDQLLSVISSAKNAGKDAVSEIMATTSDSLKDILEQQVWSAVMSGVFQTFTDELGDAMEAEDQQAVINAYAKMFEGVLAKQEEFNKQMSIAQNMAAAAGLDIFTPDTGSTTGNYDAEIDQYRKFLDQMKTVTETDTEAIRAQIEQLYKTIESFPEDLKNIDIDSLLAQMDQLLAEEDQLIRANADTSDVEKRILAVQNQIDVYNTYADEYRGILAEIARLEQELANVDYASESIPVILEKIAELEAAKADFIGTVAYYEEEIARINETLQGMTLSEVQGIDGQNLLARKKELEALLKELNAAINGENATEATAEDPLEKERQRYELYKKWVELYGEAQAEGLMAMMGTSSATYETMLEAEKARLEEIIKAGEATEEQMADFLEIQSKLDEISKERAETRENAQKDAYNAWKGELDSSLENATSNLEKLRAYQQSYNDLLNNSKMSQEDWNAAIKETEKNIAATEKQIQSDLYAKYKTSEQEYQDKIKEYEEDIATALAVGNTEAAAEAARQRDEYISGYLADLLESTKGWEDLMGDLSGITREEAETAIEEARKYLNETEGLSEEYKQEQLAKLLEIEKQLDDLDFDNLIESANQVLEVFDALIGMMEDMGADSQVTDNLREVSSLASNIISAVSSFASGNIVGGIVSVIGAISSGVSLISQLFDPYARKIAEATAEVERQERAYSRLQKEIANTLGKSDTAEKKAQAIAVQQSIIAALQEQLKAEQEKKQSWWDPLGWFTSGPDEEKIAELTDAINDAYSEINSIVESMVDDFYGQDIDSIVSKYADVLSTPFDNALEKAKALRAASKEIIKQMVLDWAKAELMSPAVKNVLNGYFAENKDSKFTKESLNGLMEDLEGATSGFSSFIESLQDVWGTDDVDSSAASTMKSITQPQANELIGLATGARVIQNEMKNDQKTMGQEMAEIARLNAEMLEVVRDIRDNTNQLQELPKIRQEINKLGNNNSLYGTGLNV